MNMPGENQQDLMRDGDQDLKPMGSASWPERGEI